MGALFGWKAIPAIVLLASLAGILISVPLLLLRRRRAAAVASAVPPSPAQPVSIRKAEVPFGPFLAASALTYLFLGKLVWDALMRTLTGE
jgi:leader peptidase (prepilin peptidase) / N-methyltransferase